MNLLAAERIKLFSTRSPWWCTAVAIALVVGGMSLLAITAPAGIRAIPIWVTAQFLQFGMVVVMVMATVSVTTEYRFSTIRTTFQAVPNRTAVLLAKTAVVGIVATIAGLLSSFGALAMVALLRPDPSLALTTDAQWRAVVGAGPAFLVAAVLAVAVGILIRQTAGAVALLLVWTLLVENLIRVIPEVGPMVHQWMPFTNVMNFLAGGSAEAAEEAGAMALTPWASLGYTAAVAAVLLAVAIATANRRDA
ncbi:hypothetical protein WEH80_05490 [Actinomycetes bacterium KLBMP 9759]